ncbi:MAG: Ig-like domain-containing protein [Anaerolineae bacterium]
MPDYSLYSPDRLLSLIAGVLLALAGRAMTVHPAARWEERARPLGRAVALGLLLFGLWYPAAMGRLYLCAASWPGALAHLALFPLSALAAGWLLVTWWRTDQGKRGLRLLWTLALLAVEVGGALALTWPRVVSTVPPNGATGVPQNTQVVIRMRPSWLESLLGDPGTQFFAYYPDTGKYIYGSYGFWPDRLFTFSPEGLLRPDAPVEVVVRRGWERPYRLRFTTAGPNSPTATPMPTPLHPIGPVPTALPTATLNGGEK